MKKVSDVFKSIRFAKGEPRGKKHSSTDDEEHGTVGEMDFDQQLAHAKKRAMQEAKDPGEYDQEGDMAMTQLRSIIYHAQELHDQLDKNDNLPEWVQSKITLAQDYMQTACDYMYSQKNEEVVQEKRGLWDNIHDKRKRIAAGSGERMRKPGSEGAPSAEDLKNSQVKEEMSNDDKSSVALRALVAKKNLKQSDGKVKSVDFLAKMKNRVKAGEDLKKEEVEIQEAEALVENFEIINEVSLGAKIRAYASHSGNAFAHDDMGNDKEYKHHSVKANKIIAHIEKHHGKEAVKHAERAAHSQIFGHPDHEHSGKDRLSGGLRGNKTLTKAGKVPKNTVSAMKNKIMAYGRHRDTAGPKAKLPEEVEHIEEGRQSQRHPLEGHEYHKKSDETLIHIAKDAHAAAEAMKSHNTDAENKYRDQANDSATVRHYRKTHGMADWYKKKYGHIKEEVVEEGAKSPGVGWMLKADPKLGEKVKANKEKYKEFKQNVGKKTTPMKEEVVDEEVKDEYARKVDKYLKKKHGKDDSQKKLPQGASFAAARRKARLASNGRMDEALSPAIRMQMALQKAKEDRERSERNGEAAMAGKFSSGPAKQPMKNPSLVSPKNEEVIVEDDVINKVPKPPFDEPTRKARDTVKDKSGAVHTPMSRVRDIARTAARKQAGIKEAADINDPLDKIDTSAKRSLSRTAGMVKDLATNAKAKAKSKDKKDAFEPEPELSSQIMKQD